MQCWTLELSLFEKGKIPSAKKTKDAFVAYGLVSPIMTFILREEKFESRVQAKCLLKIHRVE
jgi:hypothetical protein